MRGMIRIAAIGLAFCALGPAAAQESGWHARLSTVPIDPSLTDTIAGHGEASAELAGKELRITGTFTGLKGPATIAQLRVSPYVGVRGQPIADLTVSPATEGSVSGSVELTPEQIEALRGGRLYIQIHSQTAPEGNLWGWLVQ
ncbi:MAG TPA: CHRD domain-containing protein [Gammaproteobacteria bacterium]